MRIDGKALADEILAKGTPEVEALKKQGTTPTLAVILVGDNPASLAYIKQKQKAAERIGATVILSRQPPTITKETLQQLVSSFNADPKVHGLIIQRPVPDEVGDVSDVLNSVAKRKDVDGFLPHSPFDVPVARAVWEIIRSTRKNPSHYVVIGRGETAGGPIARYLTKQGIDPQIIHSKTPNPTEIIKQADVIISCVGKERVVIKDTVKPGAILISVGIWRDEQGKLRGDYDEEEVADVASFYTPTPSGVGPVNVACLMQNLVKACMMSI